MSVNLLIFVFFVVNVSCQANFNYKQQQQMMMGGQGGRVPIGTSLSGLPIFQGQNGNILYPVESEENSNVVEWVEITNFMSGATISGVDANGFPFFKLADGRLAYLTVTNPPNGKIPTLLDTKKPNLPSEVQNQPKKPLNPNAFDSARSQLNIEIPKGIQATDTCYIPHNSTYCAPHFIISGAMKSGTTSLFTYLLNHPKVLPLVNNPKLNGVPVLADKEVRFFNDPTFSALVSVKGVSAAFDDYLNVFNKITPSSGVITGESSPMYIVSLFSFDFSLF